MQVAVAVGTVLRGGGQREVGVDAPVAGDLQVGALGQGDGSFQRAHVLRGDGIFAHLQHDRSGDRYVLFQRRVFQQHDRASRGGGERLFQVGVFLSVANLGHVFHAVGLGVVMVGVHGHVLRVVRARPDGDPQPACDRLF